MRDNVDVIVVGSGASGAVACNVLIERGYSVLCIEKGDYFKGPFPTDFYGWESAKCSFNPNVRKSEGDYDIDTADSPIDVANFNGVGGSTVLFSGHYPRFHVSDFMTSSRDGVGQDWPFDYDQLAPHYRANEEFLEIAGLPGDPAYPDLMDHLKKPVPIGSTGKVIVETMNRLGWHCWPSYSAIKTEKSTRSHRNVCTNIGACNTGCPKGAKSSADVTFLADALAKGLELITKCSVLKITVDRNNGRANGVVCRDSSGREFSVRSKAVMLAGNAIGSLRILSNSSDSLEYLGNSSGQIGRNFMIHPLGYVEGALKAEGDAHVGPQGSWIASHQFYETNRENNFKRGYTLHFLKNAGPVAIAKNGLLRRDLSLGPEFIPSLKKRLRSLVGIAIICEDLPEFENRVDIIRGNVLDADGLPKVKVVYQLSENTKKMMKHGISNAVKILEEAGASNINATGPVRFAGWHLTGTLKMGVDSRSSVVAPNGEFHDIPGLFAIDGSVFPTSSSVNPAATIQAVARKISSEFSLDD